MLDICNYLSMMFESYVVLRPVAGVRKKQRLT